MGIKPAKKLKINGYFCGQTENRKSMTEKSRQTLIKTFLVVLAVSAYTFGLFIDVTRDGSKYASVAREIYETGNFIDLKIHGEPYDQKPPMLFWLSALSFYLFGLSNFAFKLPLLLLAWGGLYSVYRLGKSLYDRRTGLLTAALLGSSQMYFLYCADIHTDTVMQAFVSFSLWQLFDFLRTKRNINFILGFVGVGLAMLSKGPMGAVVPAAAVVGHLIFTRRYRELADIRWYIGIVIVAVIIWPALAGLYRQFGWEGIVFYFWTNNFGRISGTYVQTSNDYFFFFHNLLYLYLPWILLLYMAAFLEFRSLIRRRFKAREYFVFSGTWFFFILLAISRSKLPNYIFIIMPLMSVLTAKYIMLAISGRKPLLLRVFTQTQYFVASLLTILLLLISFWLFPLGQVWQWLLLAVVLALSVWFLLQKGRPAERLLLPSLTLIIGLNFFLNQHVFPQIFSQQAPVTVARMFSEQAGPGDRLYNYNYSSYELFFYGKTTVKQVESDVELKQLLERPGSWILTSPEVTERIKTMDVPQPEIREIKHLWMNKVGLRFVNPKTRQQAYDTLYLVKSAGR